MSGSSPRPDSAGDSAAPPGTLNIANALTLLRLLMVPVFVVMLTYPSTGWRIGAFVVFVVASLTDHIDGELARRRNLVTDFGKIADPIADKALTGSALVTLSALEELPWWVTIAILVREFGVTLLRFWVIRHGVIPASRGGKIKTVLQIVAICAYVLPLPALLDPVRWVLMGAALLITLATGADYVARAVRLRRQGRATGAA